MIPEVYIIRDLEGNEVAAIMQKGSKFTIELDTENYTLESSEK